MIQTNNPTRSSLRCSGLGLHRAGGADGPGRGEGVLTTGIGPDLMLAARDAARAMIDLIVTRTGLAPAHAYILASLAADLLISEIVDAPNWVVSMHLPTAAIG